MRNIVVNTFSTLDGVMQAPGAPQEDTSGGFQWGGWSVNYWDEMMGKAMDAFMGKEFDLLLGRKTYEIFAAHWPFVKPDTPDYETALKINAARKYVVTRTRTLDRADWKESTIIKGDVAKQIADLKMQGGLDLQVHGSSNLIQTLLKNDLINKLHVWIFPLTIGSGKRLFAEGTLPANFKLTDSKVSTTGVIIATYERGGKLETGSFALEESTKAEVE
jgi:dihydrofolate reductase